MTLIQSNLIALRKQSKATQLRIAKELGIKTRTYQSYEEGRANPSLDVILKIEELYGITFRDLYTKNISF